jgi:hypothetical protein
MGIEVLSEISRVETVAIVRAPAVILVMALSGHQPFEQMAVPNLRAQVALRHCKREQMEICQLRRTVGNLDIAQATVLTRFRQAPQYTVLVCLLARAKFSVAAWEVPWVK